MADCAPMYDLRLILVLGIVMIGVTVLMAMTYRYFYIRYSLIVVLTIVAIVKRRSLIAAIKRLKNKG